MPIEIEKKEKELQAIRKMISDTGQTAETQTAGYYQAQKKNISDVYNEFLSYKNGIEKNAEQKIGIVVENANKFHGKVVAVTNEFYEASYKSIKTTTGLFFVIVLLILLSDAGLTLIINIFSSQITPIISPMVLTAILSIILPIALLLCLLIYYHMTRNIDKTINDSIEKINQQEPLEKIEVVVPSPPDVARKINNGNIALDNAMLTLRQSTEAIKGSIPVIDALYREKKFIARWENTCDEVKNALILFDLKYEKQIADLQKDPPTKARETEDDVSWQNLIVEELFKTGGENKEILRLLVEHYNAKNTVNTWKAIINNESLALKLAKLLHCSGQILVKDISVEELNEIVKKNTNFDTIQLSKDIHTYRTIKGYLSGYRKKLLENGLRPRDITASELIKLIDFSNDFELNFFAIFSILLISIPELKNRKAYEKAITAILLHSDLDLKQKALSEASDDEAILVLLSYQELLRKTREGGVSFKLKQLLDDEEEYSLIKSKIDNEDRTLQQMFEMYKAELQRGNWYDSPSLLLQKTLTEKMNEFNDKLTKVEKYGILKRVLEENFKKININTVEKAIDANLFSVYVILVKTESGHLINNIDLLSGVGDGFSKKSISDLKDLEGQYNVVLLSDDEPIYNFIKYSTSARIGVLKRDTPFDKFVVNLKQTIKSVLGSSSEQFMGSIAVLRITPSKYSFGLMSDEDLENIENVHTTTKLDIANIITNLAGDYVGYDEKAIVTSFDAQIDIFEVINKFMLLELVEKEGLTIPDKDKKSLRSDNLKSKIFENLSDVQITTLKELVLAIGTNTVSTDKIKSAIKSALSSDFNVALQEKYSNVIINSLKTIYVLLER